MNDQNGTENGQSKDDITDRPPGATDILKDAIAAIFLMACTYLTTTIEDLLFSKDTPFLLSSMLFVSELILFFGFVHAALSAFKKIKLSLSDIGATALIAKIIETRVDLLLFDAMSSAFRKSLHVGAAIGTLCGGMALFILLMANLTPEAKERIFFWGGIFSYWRHDWRYSIYTCR